MLNTAFTKAYHATIYRFAFNQKFLLHYRTYFTNSMNYFSTKKHQPISIPSFNSYSLMDEIRETLKLKRFLTPSPIQDLVITEWLLKNRNIFFAAQTGTGKTLAYMIPLIQELKLAEIKSKSILTTPNRPRAIILVPNKELALQTLEVAKDFCHSIKLKADSLSIANTYSREKSILDNGIDILVSSIDKVEKHIQKKNLFFSQMSHLVCDEIDTFLDAGYSDIIGRYIEIASESKMNSRMIFLSATYTNKIKELLESKFKKDENLKILIDKNTHLNLSNLEHEFVHMQSLDKQQPLLKILKEYQNYIEKTNGGTIIFCNSIPSCQSVDYFLKDNGFECLTLHGDMPAKLRIQNFEKFKNKEVKILVSTDLGSRGLDFPFVNHVINFDFPKAASDYLHRSGRAGRAGKKGKVTSFYHSSDYGIVKELKLSYENNVPLSIGGSAYGKINKEDFLRKQKLQKEEHQEKLKKPIEKDPKEKKSLAPAEFMKFREDWEKSKENQNLKDKKIRGYKKGKDTERAKILNLQKKMKMKKSLRTTNSKYIKNVSKRIKYLKKQRIALKKKRV